MTTKPEGPAQEPIGSTVCPDCGGRIPRVDGCHTCKGWGWIQSDFPVPATPAPSQPAGAREQVMKALDWWQHSNLSIPPIAWNALCTARDALLELAQQTAAKDAEIAELKRDAEGHEFNYDAAILGYEKEKAAREAAERKRDSLREALNEILAFHLPGTGQQRGPSFTETDISRWKKLVGA